MPTPKGNMVYFSHGGGPLPILGEPSHQAMIDFMRQLPSHIVPRPDAVLVISAHWEEEAATLMGAARPEMFYDYYGFPQESYEVDYPAPGAPELAGRLAGLLDQAGVAARMDPERGFDHGLFIPLMMMYPQADIPCLQLSLLKGLDPTAHVALGRALAPLRQENILVIGSGFSFHNMGAFVWDGSLPPDPDNDAFQDWLIETCTTEAAPERMTQHLIDWESAPGARHCHPRHEHLLPLHVCAGIAGSSRAEKVFDDYILGKRAVAFLW